MNKLIPIENPNLQVLFSQNGLQVLLEHVEAEARALVPDITTKKGREAVASNAAKVARCKTYIDGLGKDYVAELKRLPGLVDAERKRMRDFLDALRDEVREPLTVWEAAEAEREAVTAGIVARLSASVPVGERSSAIMATLGWAKDLQVPTDLHPEQVERITKAKAEAELRLDSAYRFAINAEQQADELARLRQAEAERQRLADDDAMRQEGQAEARRQREAVQQAAVQQAAVPPSTRGLADPGQPRPDRDHHATINRAALAALMAKAGLTSDGAMRAVVAIAKGEIPAVTISYK